MIQANELRIGNLVNSKNDGIISITNISEKSVAVSEAHCYNHITIEFISPIPLTEEWLLKLGFNTEYKKGYIGIDHKAGGMITDFVLTYPKVLGAFQEYFIWEHSKYKYTELKYVHELQNLFFCLTGSELTVA